MLIRLLRHLAVIILALRFTNNAGGIGALIGVEGDGTWSGSSYPSRIIFATTASGATSGTERLRIDSNGRVGINRIDSSFMLDIIGNSSTGANCIRIVDGAETGHGSHPAKITAGGTYYQEMQMHCRRFAVHTWNGSAIGERFRIHHDGKVGILQASPLADVDITSTTEGGTGSLAQHGVRLANVGAGDEDVIPISATFVASQERSRSGIGFICQQAAGGHTGYAGAIGFYTRSSADGNGLYRSDEKVRINASGSVNIGGEFTQTAAKLYVQNGGECQLKISGNAAAGGTGALLILKNRNSNNSTGSGIQGEDASGQTTCSIQFINHSDASNEGSLKFFTRPGNGNLTEHMYIDSNGPAYFKNSTGSLYVSSTTGNDGGRIVFRENNTEALEY